MTPAERHADAIGAYATKLTEHREAVALLGLLIASELRRAALLGIEPRSCDELLRENGLINGMTMQVIVGQVAAREEGLQ